jgi:serine/threonine-protein kinase RsbW
MVAGLTTASKKGRRKRTRKMANVLEYQVIIPMSGEAELVAARAVEQLAENLEFDEKAIGQIRVAVIEACINAIEHSCSEDRTVYLEFTCFADRLEIIVRDRGKGFNPCTVEEPRVENKLKSCYRRGWGLMMMRRFMDEVVYENADCGTCLRMVKYLPQSPTAASQECSECESV